MAEVAYGDLPPDDARRLVQRFLQTRWWELSAKQASGLR
jgi:hypothetical protein